MAYGLSAGATAAIPPALPVTLTANVASATTTNMYTVPAGRKFYIVGVLIVPSAASNARLLVNAAIALRSDNTANVVNISSNPIMQLNAGDTLDGSTVGGAATVAFNVWGYLL